SAPPDPLAMVPLDPALATVMGHEFCCEVVETGPACDQLKVGDVVVSLPVMFDADGLHAVGFSSRYPGGYAETIVLNDITPARVLRGLRSGLPARRGPSAAGAPAGARGRVGPGEWALVRGCGPVGLAVIGALRLRGIGPIVAAASSPARRVLAAGLGADEVVD